MENYDLDIFTRSLTEYYLQQYYLQQYWPPPLKGHGLARERYLNKTQRYFLKSALFWFKLIYKLYYILTSISYLKQILTSISGMYFTKYSKLVFLKENLCK